MGKNFLFALSLLACLIVQPVFAKSSIDSRDLQKFELRPRFTLWGFTGDSTLAEGEFLVPLFGDQAQVLYLAMGGNSVENDASWLAEAGFGFRHVNSDHIYGVYALANYVETSIHNKFIIINPGLEILGNVWDININGYFPLENKKSMGNVGWAGDDFGDYRFWQKSGHDIYDARIQKYEEATRGLDLEIARVLPFCKDIKIHVGGYHFDSTDAGSVNGVSARLTYRANKITSLELANTYDNFKHNNFIFGLRFDFGAYSDSDAKKFGIATRLLDPIENDNAVLYTSSVVPIKQTMVNLGIHKEHSNVWFVKPPNMVLTNTLTSSSGDGTAENPFTGFTKTNYDIIYAHRNDSEDNPKIWFTPGNYDLNGSDGFISREIAGRFNLPNGWGLYGRTEDFMHSALGNDRATFIGGLDLSYGVGMGTLPTVLNSISVMNNQGVVDDLDARSNAALFVQNANNVILRNTAITNTFSSFSGSTRLYGIYTETSALNFLDLEGILKGSGNNIVSFMLTTPGKGYGIYADNFSSINFTAGNNTVTGEVRGDSVNSFAHAVYVNNSSLVIFSGGNNTVNVLATSAHADGIAYGLYVIASNLAFTGGENTIMGMGVGTASNGYGITTVDSVVNFTGGENSIAGIGLKAAGITETGNIGQGLSAEESTINFAGGKNILNGQGNGGQYGDGYGYGIRGVNSIINFISGENDLTGIGLGVITGNGGYAIAGFSSVIAFDNTVLAFNDKVLLHALGSTQKYGVYADAFTEIIRNGENLPASTTLADLQNFISFDNSGTGTGKAVFGGVNGLNIDWP